jgi:hypothetical protein
VGVVDDLGQQPTDVDGVGRGESRFLGQLRLGEGLLGQTLAVVEGSPDGKGMYVTSESGELALLARAHLLMGIEDDDSYAFQAMEGVSDRPSRVARSSHQNGHRPLAGLAE